MKKVFLLPVFLLTASVLFAEWSGSLDQSLGVKKTDSTSFPTSTTLNFGADGFLGSRYSWGIALSTSLNPDYDTGDSGIPEPFFEMFNPETAFITGSMFRKGNIDPDRLTMTVGRFPISDISTMVVNTPADGISFSMGYPNLSYTFTLGYTGLVWQSASSILMSNTDVNLSEQVDELFGSPRLIGLAGVRLPTLFNQNIVLNVVFQEDMWSEDKAGFVEEGATSIQPGGGGPLDTHYYELGVNGPVVGQVYHSSFFVMNRGRMFSLLDSDDENIDGVYEFSSISAFLFGTSVRYYMPQFYFSNVAFRFFFSSGDSDFASYYEGNSSGTADQFIPITPTTLGAVFSPKLGNVGMAEIQYSIKPLSGSSNWALSTLQTLARLLVFFRPTTGPLSESGINTGDGGNLVGTELDLTANITPFSDLAVSATWGTFIPFGGDAGAFTEDYLASGSFQTKFSIQASLGF